MYLATSSKIDSTRAMPPPGQMEEDLMSTYRVTGPAGAAAEALARESTEAETGEDAADSPQYDVRLRCADCSRRAGEPIDAGEWEGPRSEPTCPHCGGADLVTSLRSTS